MFLLETTVGSQGFMQDNNFASHTFIDGHVNVNSYAYQPVEVFQHLK